MALKQALAWMAIFAMLLAVRASAATTNVVLHLKSGDRIAGNIISEDTNRVVISTSWISELPVPRSAIERREIVSAPASTVATNVPATPVVTNATVEASKTKPAAPKRWKANLTLGTDMVFGAVDRQLYYGRLKLTYEQPYREDPKKFFRSIFDYSAEYGRSDGELSANRMNGSLKTDFDIGSRLYLYNLAGLGYDKIRRIDRRYELGPGVGYHLVKAPKFVMNVESGINYQAENRSDSPDVHSFYLRLAEDITWKINDRMTFTEKFEYYPNLENTDEFRTRLDATLSIGLWKNLTLDLTLLDLYDSAPANDVDKNELQIRSALGINF